MLGDFSVRAILSHKTKRDSHYPRRAEKKYSNSFFSDLQSIVMLNDDDTEADQSWLHGDGDILAAEVASSIDSANSLLITHSVFLRDMETAGMWDRTRLYDSRTTMTIFVPMSHASTPNTDLTELWNRHTTRGQIRIGGDGTLQIVTQSNLVYALYPISNSSTPLVSTTTRHAVGAVAICDAYNVEYNGCIFHAVTSSLPDLRPVPGYIETFRTSYISNEIVEFQFMSMGIDPEVEATNFTLIASLTDSERVPFAKNQKTSWHGNGTQCSVVIPSVSKRQNGMLWFSLYDNKLRHPVVTMAFPWYLIIEPNVLNISNLRILDINPKAAKAHTEIWIRGYGFDERVVRVMFDNQVALVVGCDSTLIRCFVPAALTLAGAVHVWVTNANVYTRYDGQFTLEV